jgi:hypothetical protein
MDIVHHKHKITKNTMTGNKLDTDHNPPLINDHLRLNKISQQPPLSNDQTVNSPSTPYFNLQLFDDSDEFQSDDNDNEKLGTNSTKRAQEDADDGDDDENASLHHTRQKSHSLDDLSIKSMATNRRHVDTTRDVLRRRPALDPGGAYNLRTYVRHRKDSIVQRVIGYNYDDHSTAGGLYIRVGIGSRFERFLIDIL